MYQLQPAWPRVELSCILLHYFAAHICTSEMVNGQKCAYKHQQPCTETAAVGSAIMAEYAYER